MASKSRDGHCGAGAVRSAGGKAGAGAALRAVGVFTTGATPRLVLLVDFSAGRNTEHEICAWGVGLRRRGLREL